MTAEAASSLSFLLARLANAFPFLYQQAFLNTVARGVLF